MIPLLNLKATAALSWEWRRENGLHWEQYAHVWRTKQIGSGERLVTLKKGTSLESPLKRIPPQRTAWEVRKHAQRKLRDFR